MREWIRRHPEIKGVLWLILALSQFVSLSTFNAQEASHNWLGLTGHLSGWFWYFSFGFSSLFILLGIAYHGARLAFAANQLQNSSHFVALFIAGASLSLLFTMCGVLFPSFELFSGRLLGFSGGQFRLGGMPFYAIFQRLPYISLEQLFSFAGTAFIALSVLFFSLTYFFELSMRDILAWL